MRACRPRRKSACTAKILSARQFARPTPSRNAGRSSAKLPEAALHWLLQLRAVVSFGVPKYEVQIDQMMKCDMCYDRTSIDKKPMCATVCPSQALTFATAEEIQRTRRGVAINRWKFGQEEVTTKVFVIVPREVTRVNVELVQISPTPSALSDDPYDVALMLENVG